MSKYKLFTKEFVLLDSCMQELEEFIAWDNIRVISHNIIETRMNMYSLSVIYEVIDSVE
ncbi:hypothetical protein ACMGE7_08985 [Macrococcus equi]|uniref:hypothetical protein n=1 Tax=Macrococcus equi TaxID=3395462 RepID=UPI0039BEA006